MAKDAVFLVEFAAYYAVADEFTCFGNNFVEFKSFFASLFEDVLFSVVSIEHFGLIGRVRF